MNKSPPITEQDEFELLAGKEARLVLNKKRYRAISKRGDFIWRSHYFGGWIWIKRTVEGGE